MSIFKQFLGGASLLVGLLALLCLMPAAPARAGDAGDTPGDCPPPGRQGCGGLSIILPFGNEYYKVTDFATVGQNQLAVTRHYNSEGGVPLGSFGNWRWTYDLGLGISATEVDAIRADGKDINFFPDGKGGWKRGSSSSGIDLRLTQSGSTWTLTDWDDNIETYTAIKGGSIGVLASIKARDGYTQTMHYTGKNPLGNPILTSVTDSYGRALTITYSIDTGGIVEISSITTPDGLVLTYSYTTGNLAKVTYPTSPATSQSYLYEDTNFVRALTGIIDENGNRFATWTYVPGTALTLAASSQHAGGADLTQVAYESIFSRGNATVTSALGLQEVYKNGFPGSSQIEEIDRLGTAAVRRFTYDSNGYVASETDWNGNLTAYVNNVRGLPKTVNEASGTSLARTTTTSWHPTFHLPVQITEPNRTTAFTYDANGNVLTKKITAGALTRSLSYTYNATGEVLAATDPRGNVTHYTYDAKGNLTSITNALGQVTNFTSYDGAGRPLAIIDPNGVTTSLTYDPRGRLTSQTVGTLKTMYAYDAAGNLIKVTQPDNSTLTYKYDQAHRLTKIKDALGNHIIYTLDAAGNHIKEQAFDPSRTLTQTRSFAYNALNRLKKTIGAEGQTTAYAYDPQGNLTAVTDPLIHVTSYAYDALNRLAEAIDPKGEATFYGYDANDHLTSVTDPRDLKTVYKWDGLDDQLKLHSPDTGVTKRTFDTAGNVVTSTDARGNTTTYSYDALNRRTHAAFADGTSAAWHYDKGANGIGRLTKIRDVTGSTSYSYDANGHVTQKQQSAGAVTLTTVYGYDAGGRLASITYPSGKEVAYAYDPAGRVSSVTANGKTLVMGVTYMPFGGASGWTAGNGASYRRTFDLDGRISGLALPASDTIALSYDAASRITGMTETGFAAESFSYNTLDRLHVYASGAATQTYTYDADGNRTGYATNATPPVSLTYTYDTASNRLLGIGGSLSESFTYDANGNMLSYSAPFADYSFSYDARNRLAESFVGAIGTSWQINGLGQRISQVAAGVPQFFFVYDEAGHLIGKYDGGGNLVQETVGLGDLPVAVLSPSGRFYVAPDHLGSPHQITNAGGAVAWLWHHDPFGKGEPSDPLGTFTYDLRFPGQFFDQSTKLHYNYFRDYDPRLGRYIESDPIGLKGGINTYAYAKGNPVGIIDPSGLGPFGLPINFSPTPPFVSIDPGALLAPHPGDLDIAKLEAIRDAEVAAYDLARKLLKNRPHCRGAVDPNLKKLGDAINSITIQINNIAAANNNASAMIDNGFINSPGALDGHGGEVSSLGGSR
ncbi:MAG: RHS repeat-associated core domain-containing protein [Methylocella sp.]